MLAKRYSDRENLANSNGTLQRGSRVSRRPRGSVKEEAKSSEQLKQELEKSLERETEQVKAVEIATALFNVLQKDYCGANHKFVCAELSRICKAHYLQNKNVKESGEANESGKKDTKEIKEIKEIKDTKDTNNEEDSCEVEVEKFN